LKFFYLIKESLRGFKTAKLSAIASIITITISLLLLVVYYTLFDSSTRFIRDIKERVELEVFLNDEITTRQINEVREALSRIGGIKQMNYVSKEEAASIFEQEFGRDMLDVLEYNPLPPSLKINLYDEYKTKDRIEHIKSQIIKMPLVDNVIYHEEILDIIERNTSALLTLNLSILLIITVSSIFLISNTIRLVINSKGKMIEVLKLLGASKKFIRTPFLIEGFVQGLAGGILAIGLIYFFIMYYNNTFAESIFNLNILNGIHLLYLILFGILLGVTGSIISVRKFLKFKT
jgi:cell division transport system permease protein